MRAVRFARHGGPEVLEMVEVPSPVAGPGEVVVAVHAVSANPVDGKIRRGMLGANLAALPSGTGRDGAGVVIATGEGVPADLKGQRVCFLAPRGVGSWVEEIALPAAIVAPIPDDLSFTDAASLPLAGSSAWIGLVDTAGVKAGDRVLVHAAAGGVGGMAVQIAHAAGARVFATCSARNAAYVRGLGADEVAAYDEVAFETVFRDMDVIFDLMGGEVHQRSYPLLKRGGTMACLNAAPFEDRHEAFGVAVKVAQVFPDRAVLDALLDRVRSGAIRPTVEKVLRFEDYAEAQRLSDTGHVRGKIVLTLR
jgi:NADPH:quinone reductase-like Zn-dependent oxidoreductase